jgi:streptogramin lyase/anti-sigma factor RsiW
MSAHLPFETLSALADGELDQAESRAAAQHLRACERCSAELASLGRLERVLAAPPSVDCPTALTFLSAQHDRELTPDEALIATAHVVICATCRTTAAGWRGLDATLAGLSAAQPSRSVDAAILALTGRSRGGRPTFGRGLVNGVAVRAAVAVGLVIAVAVAGIQQPGRQPTAPGSENAALPLPPIAPRQVIVASAQQALLNPRTNTYFVAYPDDGKVNVLNATSLQDIASIDVGGHPIALALNENANTVLVLDSTQKLLSEIDANTNTLIGQTPINTAGTPTAVQVDPANGRILIAVSEPASPQSATASGAVVVLDSSSKKLETTSSVAVAPRQVVTDAHGDRALLVSADVVTVVDATTYKPLDQLPGGVGATFSTKSNSVAILSATGTGTRVMIVGEENASLNLLGSPVAIIARPQGGYAVLTDETLNGRITEIAVDGTPGRNVSVSLVGRELTYNGQSGVYAVAGSGGIAIATIAGQVVVTTPAPVAAAKPTPSESASNARPATSPAPAAAVAPAPAAARPERVETGLPAGATLAWAGVYRLELPDRSAPEVVGHGRAGHLWFVDAANRLTSVDAATGQTYTIAELPAAAKIRSIEVGAQFVYAIDVAASRVYIVSLATEKFTSLALPFVKSSDAVTLTPDDVLWFAVADQVLRLDPRTNQTEAANIGLYSVGAMAGDSAGRVWFSDEGHQKIGLYDRRTHAVVELSLPRKGSVTSMVVDATGTLVVGTDAGEIFAIQNGALVGSSLVGRPITSLVLDPTGNAWYLSGDSRQTTLGAARLKASVRQLPASIVGVWFDAKANAWLADRTSSGFFIAVPEAR